jgi:hypothetical protein
MSVQPKRRAIALQLKGAIALQTVSHVKYSRPLLTQQFYKGANAPFAKAHPLSLTYQLDLTTPGNNPW